MKPNSFDRLLRKLNAASRDVAEISRRLHATPEPDAPDIKMGTLRDVVRLSAELGEKISYECARGWLLTDKLRRLFTSTTGYYVLDIDHARRFLEERKRRRETDAEVHESELEAAWPRRQSVERLANELDMHPTQIQWLANLKILKSTDADARGLPTFGFTYRQAQQLRAQRIELSLAVQRAVAAAEEEESKKKRECDAAAMWADQENREKIEAEHARQDRIAGLR